MRPYTFGRAGLGGMCVWWEVCASIYILTSGLGRYVRMVGGMCVLIHLDKWAWEVCVYDRLCPGLDRTKIYTVYAQYFWQGNHQIYGHVRCVYIRFWPTRFPFVYGLACLIWYVCVVMCVNLCVLVCYERFEGKQSWEHTRARF